MREPRFRILPVMSILFLVHALVCALSATPGLAFNWDWDQGHDCVEVTPGRWGHFDPDGKWVDDPCCWCKLSPVFARSGSLQQTVTDIEIPGTKPHLAVVRTYNGDDLSSGLVGHGWTISFGKQLIVVAKNDAVATEYVIVKLPDGQRHRFYPIGQGMFEIEPGFGVGFTLTQDADRGYVITDSDGTEHEYGPDGRPLAIVDMNGRRLSFQYDVSTGCISAISDELGRGVSIVFGGNGKIASITDFAGRTVDYSYDVEGNLVSVQDVLGDATTYEYDALHRLIGIVGPSGNAVLAVTYDDYDRVVNYVEEGESYYIVYSYGKTEKFDSRGNKWTCFFNDYGFMEKEIDPLGNVNLRHHNLITSTSVDWETIGGREPVNLCEISGATASASSVYSPDDYGYCCFADYAIDGDVETYWLNGEYDPSPWLQVDFPSPVDVSSVIIENPYYYYDYAFLTATLEFSNGYTVPVTLGQPSVEVMVAIQAQISWVKIAANTVAGPYQVISEFKVMSVPAGGVTYNYTYDSYGNRTSVTDPLGNMTRYTYNGLTGRIETITDARGVVTKYEFDDHGNVVREYHAFGTAEQTVAEYEYDANANLTRKTDPSGRVTTYAYDSYGNITSQMDPLGNTTTFTYDLLGNMLSATDANGNTTVYGYDALGRTLHIVNALGDTAAQFAYDANGNKTMESHGSGNTTLYQYDSNNDLVRTIDPLGNSTSRTYEYGELASTTDPEGHVTYFKHDVLGNLITVVNKVGDTEDMIDEDDIVHQYTYDAGGNLATATDPVGAVTAFAYDPLGRLIQTVSPTGDVVEYAYDEVGNLASKRGVDGNVTHYEYDTQGRPLRTSDLAGDGFSYQYDAVGNTTAVTDANGHTTAFSYDPLGRILSTINAEGAQVSATYDAAGRIQTYTDREGLVTTFSYDGADRLVSVSDGMGRMLRASYGPSGRLTSLIDANGNPTFYDYDEAGRLVRETYADHTSQSYAYNPAGLLVTRTDQNGNAVGFEYDEIRHLTKIDYPGSDDNVYSYDKAGRLIAAANGTSILAYQYDAAGRPVQCVQDGRTVQYLLDFENGTRNITYSGGMVIRETRDSRGRVTRIEDGDMNLIATYQYDESDNVINKTYANGVVAAYSYTPRNLLEAVRHEALGTLVAGYEYRYTPQGVVRASENLENGVHSHRYDYDPAHRLTEFKEGHLDGMDDIPSPIRDTQYDLDFNGNWLRRIENGVTESRQANSVNEYTIVGGTNLVYDANGNLVDDGANRYAYDYDDRLIRVSRAGDGVVLAEFGYDALGRRVVKRAGGVETRFVYDEYRVIEEIVGGLVECSYVYGVSLDEIVMMERAGQRVYYHDGNLGNILCITDDSGNVVERYNYDAYGGLEIRDANGDPLAQSQVGNLCFFTGQRFDQETGLYYFRARYYDPVMGRFVSRDPKGYGDGFNLYEYARSSPANWIDPMGTQSRCLGSDDLSWSPPEIDLGKLFSFSAAISGSYCTKCCEQGTRHVGELVNDWEASVEFSLEASGEFIPPGWGITIPWLGYIGLKFEITLATEFTDIHLKSDYCNDGFEGGGCFKVSGTGRASIGSDLKGRRRSIIRIEVYGETGVYAEVCASPGEGAIMLNFRGCFAGMYGGFALEWFGFLYEPKWYIFGEWCPFTYQTSFDL